jgi:mRNA interferase RelE/StbE
MDLYKIEWKRSAKKELRKLDKATVPRILKAVELLAENPYPQGSRKLVGSRSTYRLRVGEYRVIYNVRSSVLIVEIIRVGHRQGIYKQ